MRSHDKTPAIAGVKKATAETKKTITLFISLDHFEISVDIERLMFLVATFVGNRFKIRFPISLGGGSPIIEALGGFVRSEFSAGVLERL